jgi:hypothetical protein
VQEFERRILGDTSRTTRMLSSGLKTGSLLGSMHWTLIEFHSPLLATSDHPIVPWPLGIRSRPPQATSLSNGIFKTLELRVPISPRQAVVMTWLDDEDPAPLRGSSDVAGNLNAFTVAQAERQWFHSPERVPPLATGQLLPLSPPLLHGYDSDTVLSSRRRHATEENIRKLIEEELTHDVEMVVVSRHEKLS